MNKKNINEDDTPVDESDNEEQSHSIIMLPPPNGNESVDTRIIGIYGVIDEEKCKDVVSGLYYLKELGKTQEPTEDEESVTSYEPIKFLISTEGGLVMDMFAVYDAMRDVQKDCEVHTFGLGKVMSAGVLLLAAGTKGKRRIGKNCRLMMHQITSGNYGHVEDQENSLSETRWIQERYIEELCGLTKLTKRKIESIFKKKIDYYFSAVEAVKFGIVDEIV